MTLTGSGQISFNDLRVELGVSGQAPFSIASASTGVYATINTNSPSYPNASEPHAISEWYSYNHSATTTTTTTTAACQAFAYAVVTSLTDCSTGSWPNTGGQTAGFSNGSTLYGASNCRGVITDTYIQTTDGTNYQLSGGIIQSSNNPNC